MTKQTEMNYGELCDFFKEEKRGRGKQRKLQFDKWRKEYNIEKIEGKNKYIVERKTYKEVIDYNNKRKNVQFTTLLAPVIYTTLMNAEENVIALTSLEQQRAFALINSKFGLKSIYQNAIAKDIGVNIKDLYAFKESIWKINNQTINNVINSMLKKHIILTGKGFKYQDKKTKEWYFAGGDYGVEILAKINEISMELYDDIYYKILDKNKKKTVKDKVCDFFGFETLYSSDIYYLDKKSIKFIYEKDIKVNLEKMLLSEEDIPKNLIEINTNNCIKLSKSKNKTLSDISKYDKEKMISALISETEEECKKNYKAIISNTDKSRILYENPNKKNKKVIDTESSL